MLVLFLLLRRVFWSFHYAIEIEKDLFGPGQFKMTNGSHEKTLIPSYLLFFIYFYEGQNQENIVLVNNVFTHML